MKNFIIRIYFFLKVFGIDPLKSWRALISLPRYFRDLFRLNYQKESASNKFSFGMPYPCLGEHNKTSGTANGHYFHQDLLIARRIFLNNPNIHVDIGSRVDGFVAHVAAYREIEVIDIRPITSSIPNIKFLQIDFMNTLPDDLVKYCDSLSCLHAMEHFGLGRYGDLINYDGYILGIANLHKLLEENGKLYFSAPIGPQRIEFNAHRVFSVKFLLECFTNKFRIDNFSYVDDKGDLHEDVSLTEDNIENNFGCYYGCGIMEMTKIKTRVEA